MEEKPARRSALGTTLTMAGAVLGVLAVLAFRIQLKASISPDNHKVTLIRSLISAGAVVAFGLSAALIFGGAWIGRRRRLRDRQEGIAALAELQESHSINDPRDYSSSPESQPTRDRESPQ